MTIVPVSLSLTVCIEEKNCQDIYVLSRTILDNMGAEVTIIRSVFLTHHTNTNEAPACMKS